MEVPDAISHIDRRTFLRILSFTGLGGLVYPAKLLSHITNPYLSRIVVTLDSTATSGVSINAATAQVMMDASIKALTEIQDVGEADGGCQAQDQWDGGSRKEGKEKRQGERRQSYAASAYDRDVGHCDHHQQPCRVEPRIVQIEDHRQIESDEEKLKCHPYDCDDRTAEEGHLGPKQDP